MAIKTRLSAIPSHNCHPSVCCLMSSKFLPARTNVSCLSASTLVLIFIQIPFGPDTREITNGESIKALTASNIKLATPKTRAPSTLPAIDHESAAILSAICRLSTITVKDKATTIAANIFRLGINLWGCGNKDRPLVSQSPTSIRKIIKSRKDRKIGWRFSLLAKKTNETKSARRATVNGSGKRYFKLVLSILKKSSKVSRQKPGVYQKETKPRDIKSTNRSRLILTLAHPKNNSVNVTTSKTRNKF